MVVVTEKRKKFDQKNKYKNLKPSQKNVGPQRKRKRNPLIKYFSLHGNVDTMRIGQEIQFLPYTGFLIHLLVPTI